MNIKELIEKIKEMDNCKVLPATSLPKVSDKHKIPDDLKEFYSICGGMLLFDDSNYAVKVLEPNNLTLANPLIIGELCEEDITSEWYTIVLDGNGDYLTIDLSEDRNGRCYDSFWDRHGVVGECPIIARSFIELLTQLIDYQGKNCYWLDDGFKIIGDAYENIEIE